jgi:hypothetical protein
LELRSEQDVHPRFLGLGFFMWGCVKTYYPLVMTNMANWKITIFTR